MLCRTNIYFSLTVLGKLSCAPWQKAIAVPYPGTTFKIPRFVLCRSALWLCLKAVVFFICLFHIFHYPPNNQESSLQQKPQHFSVNNENLRWMLSCPNSRDFYKLQNLAILQRLFLILTFIFMWLILYKHIYVYTYI